MLWRLRSPTMCCLQAGDLRKNLVPAQVQGLRSLGEFTVEVNSVFSPSLKAWELEGCPRVGDQCPNSTIRQSTFSFPPPFCSIQVLNGLDAAHLHLGGQSTFLDSNANLFWKQSHRQTQK